jgi:MscS family membrane protein
MKEKIIQDVNSIHSNTGVVIGTVVLVGLWLVLGLMERRGQHLGGMVAKAIRQPLLFGLSASLYLGWLGRLIANNVEWLDGSNALKISATITILAVTWALSRLGHTVMETKRFERWLQLDDPKDRAMAISFIGRIYTILILVIGAGALMIAFGIPVTALAALAGGAGVGLAFGTQNISQNFFSGFMLFFNRPFKEGDWISTDGMVGTVEHIGWYHTRLCTFDRRPMFIPNAVFATNSIINPGQMYNRRILANISLRYEDIPTMDTITKQVRELLSNHNAIDNGQIILVHFNAWESSSLNLQVYCFTKTTNWQDYLDIQQEVFLEIAKIVKSNNADFAFDCTTLYPAPNLKPEQLFPSA